MNRVGKISRSAGQPMMGALAIVFALTGALMVAAFSTGPAPTVHSGLFELGPAQGADILCSDTIPGPDWGCIFDASGTTVNLYGGIAAAFEKDPTSQSGSTDWTTFSGAGTSNKNNDPVSCPPGTANCWHWDAGNVPAKDDFSNGYAWATINPANGHLIVYAGFERLDPSGDSHVDLEFFQDTVHLDEAPPCNDPGPDPTPCNFVGNRMVNDVIVSMDYLTGGKLGSVSFRAWDGSQYVLDGSVGGEGCNTTDTLCGFNNGALIDGGPWPNYDRQGNIGAQLPPNAFTEFGADVTALLSGNTPCISTFMGKTRSSQSFSAELKDFGSPVPFPICGAAITIGPSGVNEVRQPHTFTVHVFREVAGQQLPAPDGTIVTVTLTDTNGASHTLISDNCASPGTVSGLCTVTFTSTNGATHTLIADGCAWRGTVAGLCTVTFTSLTAGTVTGHASADVNIGRVVLPRETDGIAPNSGDAVKVFVAGSLSWTK